MAELKSTADVSRLTGAPLWLIRRLADRLSPPPLRFRGYRMFGPEDLGRLQQALAEWHKKQHAASPTEAAHA
jgi:hypothetical protein